MLSSLTPTLNTVDRSNAFTRKVRKSFRKFKEIAILADDLVPI